MLCGLFGIQQCIVNILNLQVISPVTEIYLDYFFFCVFFYFFTVEYNVDIVNAG